jgi:hypothetical protein
MELILMDANVVIGVHDINKHGLNLPWARSYVQKNMKHADKLHLVNSPTHFRRIPAKLEFKEF